MMRKEVIVHNNPKAPISEIFRALRTNIQFNNINNKLHTLLVTSTVPGEGKSWVVTNLAVAFAQAGKKVLILDADLRKGRQYNILGISPTPGLSDYLINVIDKSGESSKLQKYIQETDVENLFAMPAGNMTTNPSELLFSTNMINLIENLKSIFDIVIIDGTPSELVTDSVILSRIVESTLIVTAHNSTKKEILQRVVKNIQNVGGKIDGIIINKIPVKATKYSEKYYYNGNYSQNEIDTDKNAALDFDNEIKLSDIVEESKLIDNQVAFNKLTENDYNENILQNTNNETDNNINDSKIAPETEKILNQINKYLEDEKK